MILIITRKFPPSTGGMQKVIYELYAQLKTFTRIDIVAWGGRQLWLPIVLPYLFLRGLFQCIVNKNIKVIFLGDGLLAPLGYMLKILTGKKIVVMTHGLDITWSPVLYQWLIKKSLLSMDKVFCVSQNTAKECRQRHIPEEKLHVIPNGVDFKKASSINQDNHYKNIQTRLGIDLQNRPVILSVGRMVERKGIHSFLNNIFPLILKKNPQAYYIVVGDGPCRSLIENTIQEKHLQSNVLLTGQIEDKYLENLYNIAQVFVMPNIPLQGDVEGFGIVILEASARGLPAVASKIDGIVDAVKEGCNGILIDHLDYENFARKTLLFLNDSSYRQQFGKDAQKYTQNTFSWEHISREYYEVIKKLCP